jgi:hypothetical protein
VKLQKKESQRSRGEQPLVLGLETVWQGERFTPAPLSLRSGVREWETKRILPLLTVNKEMTAGNNASEEFYSGVAADS